MLLMFFAGQSGKAERNAMIAEFAGLSDAERFRAVINGKSYDWWREHLITALEFFDQMRDRVSNAGD